MFYLGPAVLSAVLLFSRHFNVDLNLHVITDDCFPGFEQVVPDEAKVLPIDGGGGGETTTRIAPVVANLRSGAVEVQSDFASGAVNCEITDHLQLAACVGDPF